MTIIQKLVMKGFKSFAMKTDIPLGAGFNVVIGPNGSGKSNVMDALCFVLGKGSTKGLRAEKASHLIYNGGKSKEPAKEGEVSITFENTGDIFQTGQPSIKITRIIRQNGQSIYKIDDKVRTRQQVLDFLSRAQITPEGHNIVLQGDIIRLIEMSSVQRREVLEEVSGISIYEEKKHRAMSELEKVEDRIKESEIILAERSTHLKELKEERDQTLRYTTLKDKIKQHRGSIVKMKLEKKQKDLASTEAKLNEEKAKLTATQEELQKLRDQYSKTKAELDTLTKEIEKKGDAEQVQLQKNIEAMKIELARKKTRAETCRQEIDKVGVRKEQLKQSLKELDEKIKQLKDQIASLEKDRHDDAKRLHEIEQKIQDFRKKHQLDSSDALDLQIDELDKATEEKEKEMLKLKEQQQNLLRQRDQLEFQLRSMDEQLGKVKDLEKQHKSELDAIKAKRDEFKKSTLELNTLLNDDSSLAMQVANAKAKLQRQQEELSKLQIARTGLKESLFRDIPIKKILENKKSFPGVFGMVSEIGKVQSKYALALEVAAGQRLKSIVVDNDKTAAQCIRYLKEQRLGVASFIPLNTVKPSSEKVDIEQVKKIQGVHDLAINLVSFEAQFKPVFSYVFASTLVVDTIDTARRIGIGRIRMVTLDGDLTEGSGVMQGGFREKSRQGMGFQEKEVDQSIEQLEQSIAEAERVVASLDQKRSLNDERIQRLRELKATLEGEIIKMEKSIYVSDTDLDASQIKKKQLQAELDAIAKQQDTLNSTISKQTQELTTCKIKRQELRTKISQLRSPVLIAEINTFEQKRQELREKNIKRESEGEGLHAQIKTILDPERIKTLKIVGQHDHEEEAFKKEIKELSDNLAKEEKELKLQEQKQQEFYQQYKALFTKKNKLTESTQEQEKGIFKQEEQTRSVEQRMNLISLEQAKFRAEYAGVEEEFRQFEGIVVLQKPLSELEKEAKKFEDSLEQLGAVNIKALEIYDSVEKEYHVLLDKRQKLIDEKTNVLVMMNEIETKKKELFMKTFTVLNDNFSQIFSTLSVKGQAYLELDNKDDPFADGVSIKVKLTSKKFMDLRSLSGGEKTLTAIAFLFAIQDHAPASFYVLDEVDAALDKRNSELLAKLVKKYSSKAQYLLISHNDAMINEADTLYGVSMNEHGMSKVYSLKV